MLLSTMTKLVGRLLTMSATEFQFPLADVIPDVDERRALIAAIHDKFPEALGEFDPSRTFETWSAWHLARYAATVCDQRVIEFEALELAQRVGLTHAELDTIAQRDGEYERGAGSREDGFETDDELRARIKAGDRQTPKFSDTPAGRALDSAHGVGPGTEFPNLNAQPVIATAPDGTVTEGVGIARRETYANQDMVEGMLGKPDGEVRDASGNLVGGMWVHPVREKIRNVAQAAIAKLQDQIGKLPMTRPTFDLIEKEIEAEGTFAIVSVEASELKTPEGYPRIAVTTMSGGREYTVDL